jgi:WD40 repeat protein
MRKLSTLSKDQSSITLYRPGHNGSIKNGALDPLCEYLATTGCDGFLHIYKVPSSDEEQPQLVKQIKITHSKMIPHDNNPFECTWSADGSKLYVGGEPSLGVVERDGDWKLTFSNHFSHPKTITSVMFINENILCTAGLDKQIRFWDMKAKI